MPILITMDMLKKRVLRDVVPCSMVEKVTSDVGLQPASPDVEDVEHRASHVRLLAIAPLLPVIMNMSVYAAAAVASATKMANGDTMDVEQLAKVIYQTSWALIAELYDVDLVHLGPGGIQQT